MPFIPLRDDNPRILIERPYVTWTIIIVCVALFLLELAGGRDFARFVTFSFGLIPSVLLGLKELPPALDAIPAWATLFTAMFLHGGLMHLVGNMLFLGIFGDNIEDSMGHRRFVAFYLLCGVAASMAHVLVAPTATQPMVGASGAISGVLGAYLMLHPKAWVTILVFIIPITLPAWLLLGFWIGFQVFSALTGSGGGVAWWAHIGGFAAGCILIIPFRHKTIPLGGGGGSSYPKGIRLKRRRPGDTAGGPWGRT
ncbi:rhomboid family intramembrane serine protease [Ferruginivarius sediminum]|uniref:Rhomboid family intramembrane serine protease n=1 Tax=Ferruginivarius sediminum TaxID=2661937 RepID=A0A369T7V8_9PROT|nr:rhomboid family intramembrane serine protease [Ferruginivarius sediminum]